jgi:UDP-N-acetylglucosamine 2-epimerase (non-hydrolysing)
MEPMMRKKILCVIGTRPEAIKMAPVILALQKEEWADVRVLATAQHRGLLDQVLSLFSIKPDVDLNIMQPNQTLSELTARLLQRLDEVLTREAPDAVIAQGDTTTVMTVALACFYQHIPFGHVEAGLRTGDLNNPFPEEMNRIVAGRLSRWHFAPTQLAQQNLLDEAIDPNTIHMTGNTVIDALLDVADRCDEHQPEVSSDKRLLLVTAHRRENFGQPFEHICQALKTLADTREDVELLYPVHPNPNVLEVAHRVLGEHPRIRLVSPLDYLPFVAAMRRAYLILSDSGGVQEEAPALGKPVLVLRNETERPEAVAEGVVKLVGPNEQAIVDQVNHLLDDQKAYKAMARGVSPYGDGHAAERIVSILHNDLHA